MRRVLTWLIAGTLALTATATLAAPPPGDGPPAAGGAPHLVRGEVTTVNETRGSLTLKTADGDVELRLPPGALKGIKKGDRITLQLVVRRPGTPAAKVAR